MEMEPWFPVEDEAPTRDDALNWPFPPLPDHLDPPLFDSFVNYDPDFFRLEAPSLPTTSAFVSYTPAQGRSGWDRGRKSKGENVHKRMLEFLRNIPRVRATEVVREEETDEGGSRCFRHMMRERQRRERLSQSYADLYHMVSPRSKADKNSIVMSTTAYLRELKGVEGELRRRNEELRGRVEEGKEGVKIRLRVGNPSSSMESMIGALWCLKSMGVKARSITCSASDQELSAAIAIETKMASREVEKAVQGVLVEVEKKLRAPPQLQGTIVGWR